MMRDGMIFDPDHMSVKARLEALEILEANRYSGVISSHSWSTPDAYPRIYALGGVVTPISGRSEGFVQEWRTLKPQAAPKFYWGFGFGSDQNGLHSQPPARKPQNPVTYPFKTFDGGSTVDKVRTGTRTWDVNVDGASHYGLFPDWIEDLRKVAGDEIVQDMARGTEAYLQMWERAVGVPADRCVPAAGRLGTRGIAGVRLGGTVRSTLRRAGQPRARTAGALRFCVDGAADSQVTAGLARSGRVRLVGSTHPAHRAGGVAPGDAMSGRGLVVRPAGGKTSFVYGVDGGRVRFVAVAPRSLTAKAARLRAAVRAAGLG
jgi:hypothetical protein